MQKIRTINIYFYIEKKKYLIEYIFMKEDYFWWKEIYLFHTKKIFHSIIYDNKKSNLYYIEENIHSINRIIISSNDYKLYDNINYIVYEKYIDLIEIYVP